MFDSVDLGSKLSKKDYRQRLPRLQRRLHQLQRACWSSGLASVLVIEGWNTAGRGAVIRKLTERLEPRGVDVFTTRRARSFESQLPPLWRFWIQLPAYGHMKIFDRSWYGRFLVQHIEGDLSADLWRSRLADIKSFEQTLAEDRYEVVKLFLHIDKDEQRRRLEKLQQDELTSWRVEERDWLRHQKYDQFKARLRDLLKATDTSFAPWSLIAATDKRWARIQVFELAIRRLEQGLEQRDLPVPEEQEGAEP